LFLINFSNVSSKFTQVRNDKIFSAFLCRFKNYQLILIINSEPSFSLFFELVLRGNGWVIMDARKLFIQFWVGRHAVNYQTELCLLAHRLLWHNRFWVFHFFFNLSKFLATFGEGLMLMDISIALHFIFLKYCFH
jgi:hypothetical protein